MAKIIARLEIETKKAWECRKGPITDRQFGRTEFDDKRRKPRSEERKNWKKDQD